MALKLSEIADPVKVTRYFQSTLGKFDDTGNAQDMSLFRSLADMSPDGVVIQCDAIIVYANQAAVNLLKFDQSVLLVGRSMMEFICKEQQNKAEYRMHGVHVERLRLPFCDYTLLPEGGGTVSVEMCGQPVVWNGKLAVQTLIKDQTNKIFKDEVFKTLSRAVEQSPDSVLIFDPNGIIEYINPYFESRFGYRTEDICDKDFNFVSSRVFSNKAFAEMVNAVTSGRVWRGRLLLKSKTNETFWVHTSISPILDKNGKISHFICTMQDMSDIQVTEEYMQKAIAAAEDASKAKSEFLANMSHELRTPLNAIIGFNSLLANGPSDSIEGKVREYASYALESGEHMLSLVEDLLDLSKVEAKKIILQEEVFPVSDIVKNVAQMVSERAKDNNCIIKTKIDQGFYLHADVRRTRQIVLNLVCNAVKFTDGGTVTIEATRENGGIIRVRDTGIGMTKEGVEMALSTFGQAENNSYAKKYEGAGLGLPISTKLVELHGGDLQIESELGVGTTVTITFPAERVVSEKLR